jgi:uncharacterized protein YqgC (DUF456 family)
MIGLLLALLAMGAGWVGTVIPGVPGASLIFLVALGHRLYYGEQGISYWVLALLGGLALLATVVDYLTSVMGAMKGGASRKGLIGAILGATIGVFFSLPGLLLGPFLGAFLLEWLGGRPPKEAIRAGVGATLGMLAGTLGKFVCCGFMILLFAADVVLRSLPPAG